MNRSLVLSALVLSSLAGCNRTHLSQDFGTNVRAALARQTIDPHAGNRASVAPQGLDPQEAAIVLDTYRKSLSPRGDADAAKRTPVMVLPPAQPGAPPPVVP